jgi:hypothetical protein
MSARTILIFVDGLGWGPRDLASNPLYSYGGALFALPAMAGAGPMAAEAGGWVQPIDAVLYVPGVPQSATGQTTLLSGINSQARLGKHLTGFPNEILREILLEHSVLKYLTEQGRRAAFLNAYRPRFWELSRERQLTLSATTVANLAADLPFFGLDDIKEGRAIYQEMTNAELIARGFDVAPLTPRQAGIIAARTARQYDFLLYEYFQTDKAGHSQDQQRCEDELQRLDVFMTSLLEELAADLERETLVLLTSDHGNIEDLTTKRHTTNPVPLLAWGDGARAFAAGITRLDQVTPAIVVRHGSS